MKSLDNFIAELEKRFKALPALPEGWKQVIVRFTPWLSLIFGLLGVATMLVALGVLTFLSPLILMGAGVSAAGNGLFFAILGLVSNVLMVLAFPGTKARKLSGWNLLFWSETVSLVSSVIVLSIGGVIFTFIGYYLLFQIKSYYK